MRDGLQYVFLGRPIFSTFSLFVFTPPFLCPKCRSNPLPPPLPPVHVENAHIYNLNLSPSLFPNPPSPSPPHTFSGNFAGIFLRKLTLYSYSASLKANRKAAVITLCVTFGPIPLYNPVQPSSRTIRLKLSAMPSFAPFFPATCILLLTVM